jgi:hypothetical protein
MVWQYLSGQIKDDEGRALGAKPNNRSNRFEVANQMNALLSPDPKVAGPFWSASLEAAYRYIPQNRPPEPFRTAQGYVVKGLRMTDKRARSGSPFRLFGTASVGSQSLTGIARLHQLRNDPKLAAVSTVWPFETGWPNKAKWLPKHVSIVHAEIYPSVRDPLPDEIKDRGQVRAMWQWARDLDRGNLPLLISANTSLCEMSNFFDGASHHNVVAAPVRHLRSSFEYAPTQLIFRAILSGIRFDASSALSRPPLAA